MGFWTFYLVVAVCGTLAVYYGVPAIRSTPPEAPPPANVGTVHHRVAPPVVKLPATENVAQPTVATTAVPPAGTPAAPEEPPTSSPPPPVAEPVAPPTSTVDVATVPVATPAEATWGFTATYAACYKMTGENLGSLPGGLVVELEGRKVSSRGEMAVCRVSKGRGGGEGTCLIAAADLVLFSVNRSEVPEERMALLKEYFGIKGQMDQRLGTLQQRAEENNPYLAAYRQANQEYQAFSKRTIELKAKSNATTGATRMRCLDELRAMIPEGRRLKQAFNQADTENRDWAAKHGGPARVDTDQDARVLELKRQIVSLEPKVRAFLQ